MEMWMDVNKESGPDESQQPHRHPEEPRSGISKDGVRAVPAAILRGPAEVGAPQDDGLHAGRLASSGLYLPREDAIFRNDLKLFCPIQPTPKKYSASFLAQIRIIICPSQPDEGRFAIVTNVGWDAVDAGCVVAHGSAGRVFGSRER
jgi:hypothetical protein